MPTYQYICDACEHEFEVFQPMGSKPKRTCPECRARRVRRRIGAGAGVLFKGSGFYETDYRSSEYQKAAKAEKDGGKGSAEGKGDGSAEKKSSPEDKSPGSAKADGGQAGGSGSGSVD